MSLYKHLILCGAFLVSWAMSTPSFAGLISEQEIKQSIIEYVRDHTSWRENQIEVTDIEGALRIVLPDESLRYKVRTAPRSSFLGRTDFEVDVLAGDQRIHSLRVTAHLAIWVDVLLASHPIKSGEVIHKEDVYVGKRNLVDLASAYLVNPEEVI